MIRKITMTGNHSTYIEPGQHIRVKPREDVKHGGLRFLNLCKMMGLNPSTYK